MSKNYGCESYDNSVPDSWVMQVTPELSKKVQQILFKEGKTFKFSDTTLVELLSNEWLVVACNTLYTTADPQVFHKEKEEISAYAFVASNGHCKWLPFQGEKCLVRSSDDVPWEVSRFLCYRSCVRLPISTNKGSFSQIMPYEEPKHIEIDFAEFLEEYNALKKFKENCKTKSQRWEEPEKYYRTVDVLGSMRPECWITCAFNWDNSKLFTTSEATRLNTIWKSMLRSADRVTFDKNNLFQGC